MTKKRSFIAISFLAFSGAAHGVSVVNWVTTNGDAGFSGGSEATNSPITTDADAETIVGSFPSVTLATGDLISLTGAVNITGNTGIIPGDQIRWGLFEAPGIPTNGVGSGYVGIWASASTSIRHADGSTTNPFSGSAATLITPTLVAPEPSYGDTWTFSLDITRLNATQVSVSGDVVDPGGTTLVSWPSTTAAASESEFTFDSVGILLGGTTDATQAAFSNIDVTVTSIPEPSSLLFGLLGALAFLNRRR